MDGLFDEHDTNWPASRERVFFRGWVVHEQALWRVAAGLASTNELVDGRDRAACAGAGAGAPAAAEDELLSSHFTTFAAQSRRDRRGEENACSGIRSLNLVRNHCRERSCRIW